MSLNNAVALVAGASECRARHRVRSPRRRRRGFHAGLQHGEARL